MAAAPVQVDCEPSIELVHGNRTADISARARPQDREAPGFENQKRCPRRCAAGAQSRTVRPEPPNPGPRTSKSDPARASNCRSRPHHAAHHGGHSIAYESTHLLRVLADCTCNSRILCGSDIDHHQWFAGPESYEAAAGELLV